MRLRFPIYNRQKNSLINKRSQSALEYMMTYGWAILIIVIVAAVLYSFGIFSPSSSISATITGFSGLGVTQAACVNSVNNQILELYVSNTLGYPVNVTKINVTGSSNGVSLSQNVNSLLDAGQSGIFYVNGACNKSSSSYSGSATITYTEPGQVFPGPYLSTGKITNVPASIDSNKVAGFNGLNSQITTSMSFMSSNFTIVYWVNAASTSRIESPNGYSMFGSSGQNYVSLWLNNGGGSGASCGSGDEEIGISTTYAAGLGIDGGVWNMVVISLSKGLAQFFANSIGPCARSLPSGTYSLNDLSFATSEASIPPFNGTLSNVEIYSRILSNSQVSSLYLEGLGGAPIPNTGLVAWWPLDGSANDYSGNNNNGVATNVNWVSS